MRRLPHARAAATPRLRSFDLTPAKSYANLLAFADNDLGNLAYERDRSVAGECPAAEEQAAGHAPRRRATRASAWTPTPSAAWPPGWILTPSVWATSATSRRRSSASSGSGLPG